MQAVLSTGARMSDTCNAQQLTEWLTAVGRDGDKVAFRALFEHFAPRLRGFMRAQGANEAAAEDLVQETMVRVWRKAALYDPAKAVPSAWIFRVARNLRIDSLRRQRVLEVEIPEGAETSLGLVDAGDSGADAVDAVRLRGLIEELPREQHEAVRLAFFEGLTHLEISEQLAVPLGTVKSRLRLAFSKLRVAIGDDS